MTIWSFLGWLAFALNVWGNIELTTKSMRGWIVRIACNLAWMPYGFYTAAWALLANHALFILINGYGWWKWRRDDARLNTPGETAPTTPVERERRAAFMLGFEAGQKGRGR